MSAKDKGEEALPAEEVKASFDRDPANVSDGTEATPGPVGAEAAPAKEQLPDEADELRRQIEQTREELGSTVEALSAKADVKGQAQAKVEEGKEQLRETQARVELKFGEAQAKAKDNPTPVAALAGGVLALLLLLLFLKRRG